MLYPRVMGRYRAVEHGRSFINKYFNRIAYIARNSPTNIASHPAHLRVAISMLPLPLLSVFPCVLLPSAMIGVRLAFRNLEHDIAIVSTLRKKSVRVPTLHQEMEERVVAWQQGGF